MAVFYSFHYERDASRVMQIRNMGALEAQRLMDAQDWEEVWKGGHQAIERWIAEQMRHKTAVVVLVGAETASRPWVRYEIQEAWENNVPLVGIRIHGLGGFENRSDPPGADPFSTAGLPAGYVQLFNPSGVTSQAIYNDIRDNLKVWVSCAIKRQP